MIDRKDRIAGVMFGAAIGDALGSAFEFMSADAIERHVGSAFVRDYLPAAPGSLLAPREPGKPTDDSALALSVAHTLASADEPTADAFARGFLADTERGSGRFAEMFWTGGPGGATMRAFRRLHGGADPATCGHPEDGGNGTAMRGHPVGVVADRNDALRLAAMHSLVTHGHPGATAAAQAVAALVWDALANEPLREGVPAGIGDRDLEEAWRATHRDAPSGERLPSHLRSVAMSGWFTVAAAHAIVLRFIDNPLDAIAAAAGSGGDTDTVACIVGGIVGARIGLRALPEKWVNGLVWRHDVEYAVEALAARFA